MKMLNHKIIQKLKNYTIENTKYILNNYNLIFSDEIISEYFNFDKEVSKLIDQYTYKINTNKKEYLKITEENENELYKKLDEIMLIRFTEYIVHQIGPGLIFTKEEAEAYNLSTFGNIHYEIIDD